jgi:hypothetical protein
MATGPDAEVTKPWFVPWSNCAWEAFQAWEGFPSNWQGVGM